MVLKKLVTPAMAAIIGLTAVGCSSKEDQESYNKYYGKDRAAREEAAVLENAAKPKIEQVVVEAPAPVAAEPAKKDTAVAAPSAAEAKPEEAKKEEKAEVAKGGLPKDIEALLNKNTCFVCHDPNQRKIGPAFKDVAKKKYSPDEIVELVHNPKPEHWPGYPPMAPMGHVPKDEIIKIAKWINSL